MLTTVLVIVVISGALVLGAAWGVYWPLPKRVKGAMVAFAGGALITSLSFELFEPAVESAGLLKASLALLAGAGLFTVVDYLIDEKWGEKSGGGLLAAVTLDGVPENIAMGVALVGAGFSDVAALAASIFLSNLPEAAGGAADMKKMNWPKLKIIGLWGATAALLSAAALGGNLAVEALGDDAIAVIRAFAAGAVVASLATEVFPQAFRETHHEAGVATALGMALAFALGA
ncbi:MAG: zinc transporter [Pseudomonadota bacterium]|nr:zinc transporter [Pseudomonadota bacterium]